MRTTERGGMLMDCGRGSVGGRGRLGCCGVRVFYGLLNRFAET